MWRPYSRLSGLMALWSVNTTLWSVGICLTTYEMAQGRFRFLWYAIPLVAAKALFLYAVTGYAYFEGVLPKFVLSVISEFNPCRLSFITVVFVVVQSALTISLLLNVLCFNKDHRKNV